MKAFGTQLIAEFLDCQQAHLLAYCETVEALLKEGIPLCGLDLRQVSSHQFDPVGVTAVAIIGESHVALHTYPETRHLAIDIFTCAPGATGPERLLLWLKEQLRPAQVRRLDVMRGQKIAVQQEDLVTDFSKAAFDVRYHVRDTLFHRRSDWQEIKIIDNPTFGHMLFLDQELQIAESDQAYNRALVQPLEGDATMLRIAILGGGDGGVLQDALQSLPHLQKAYLLELDPQVVTASQQWLVGLCGEAFADPRVEICYGDAYASLSTHKQLDAVIYDLTMDPETHTHQSHSNYWNDLVISMAAALRPGGRLTMQCGSSFDKSYQASLGMQLTQHFEDVSFNSVFIPSFCEPWVFVEARKPL